MITCDNIDFYTWFAIFLTKTNEWQMRSGYVFDQDLATRSILVNNNEMILDLAIIYLIKMEISYRNETKKICNRDRIEK